MNTMKNIHIVKIAFIAAALVCLCATAGAQTDEIKYRDDINSVKMFKSVAKHPTKPDQYLITLESFVTGSKETHEMEVRKPVDMALLLDLSGSMGATIATDKYYTVGNSVEIGYDMVKYEDYELSRNWVSVDGAAYPFLLSLSTKATAQCSQLYFRHSDGNFYPIRRGYWVYSDHGEKITDIDGNTLMGDIDYIFYEVPDEQQIANPFGVTKPSIPMRYFLGYNQETGKYEALPTCGTTAPLKLKEGKTPGSADKADYYAIPGFFVCTGAAPGSHNANAALKAEAGEITLYKGKNLGIKSRTGALVDATASFLDVIAQDDAEHLDDTKGHHRFGIVKFAGNMSDETGNTMYAKSGNTTPYRYNNTQILKPFSSISEASAAKALMSQIIPAGGTCTDWGLEKVQELFSNATDDGKERERTLVIFTDGSPTRSDKFSNEVANAAISIAKDLKDDGVTIYVVGLIDDPSDNVMRFLEYLSSDYPDAVSMTNGGSGKQFDKYFSLASTGEQLSSIFSTIADTEAKTEIGYDLSETGQVVLDALTGHFLLPEGVTANNISVGTRDFLGINNDIYNFDGGDPVPLAGANITVGGENNREIVVSGFNFAENWCGLWRSVSASGDITDVWQGKELVITIPIVVDPANPGGANNPTNEAYSGIYLADESDPTKPDMSKSVKKYPVPTLTMPNIVIKKNGLKGNDCAIFKIIKLDESGNPEAGYEPFTVMLTPSSNGKVTVKLVAEGRYKVVEESWSWSYTITPSKTYTKDDGNTVAENNYIIRNIVEATVDPTENGTVFNFSNTKRTDPATVPAHGEDAVNNVFFTPTTVVH